MAEDRKDLEEARAARRTMSFREQVRAADSYGLLLATIGLVAISIGLIGSFAPGGRASKAGE